MQITVNSPSRDVPYSSTLSSGLEKIGRALVEEHLPSIAKAVFANDELRKHLFTKFLDLLNEECSELCRKNLGYVSPFRSIAVEKLPYFTWDELADTLKLKAPTIFHL